MNILDRRLELLNMEGIGFSKSHIVKDLARKYGCTERTIWYDYAKRGKWQPKLQALKEDQVLGKVLNRYEHIYQRASLYHHYKRGKDPIVNKKEYFEEGEYLTPKDKLHALDIMIKANREYYETALPHRASVKGEVTLKQTEPFIVKMWRGHKDVEATATKE